MLFHEWCKKQRFDAEKIKAVRVSNLEDRKHAYLTGKGVVSMGPRTDDNVYGAVFLTNHGPQSAHLLEPLWNDDIRVLESLKK